VPALFHVSHIRGGDANAIGADIPGVPGIVIGHNDSVAWGITAGMANVADCYIEEFDPELPLRYRTPDGWAEADEHVERIDLRGGGSVEERVLQTRHGPVIGPALPGETRAVALRSTALEEGNLVRGFLGLWRARDVAGVEQAADDWSGTTFNIVFAHVDGTIGYRFVGSVPRSAPGEGLLPRDGAVSPGQPPVLAARELPRVINPPDGVIVSANQAPGGDLELGEEWCEPQRAVRIAELLAAEERHSVASFQRIQVDRYSAHLVSLRDLLIARGAVAHPEGPLLEAWDGMLSPRDPAAAVISMVYEELARTLAERAAGPLAPLVLGAGLEGLTTYTSFHYRLQGAIVEATVTASGPWFDDIADRDRRLVGAVVRAVEILRAGFGDHPSRWQRGPLHPLSLDHPLRAVPAIGRWFSRGPAPFGGDVNTVWQAAFSAHATHARTQVTAAYRQVIDLADFDRSTFILLSGNSGIPDHPRYDDCLNDYIAGRQRPLLYSRAAVEAAAEHWLILEPEAGRPGAGGST
jgi:penicillin amidase